MPVLALIAHDGLALIQQVARLHGGDLTIDSEYGKGSAFTLWLPTAPPQ